MGIFQKTKGESLKEYGLPDLVFLFFFLSFFFFCLFVFSGATSMAYRGSQARGLIGATAAGLHQSYSNLGSEPCLRPTPQLMATPNP